MSSNLTLQGLKIRNSPQFHFRFDNCRNVHIDSIVISAPPLSPNTNGIHIENTIGVEIYNSVISNGEPPNSYKYTLNYASSSITAWQLLACYFLWRRRLCFNWSDCYDIYIQNITCGPSHGIRFDLNNVILKYILMFIFCCNWYIINIYTNWRQV